MQGVFLMESLGLCGLIGELLTMTWTIQFVNCGSFGVLVRISRSGCQSKMDKNSVVILAGYSFIIDY